MGLEADRQRLEPLDRLPHCGVAAQQGELGVQADDVR
jgi:hypothetical protein